MDLSSLKFLFICSSLERGKDGVGDYTRMLAMELIRRKFIVNALAFNDKHIFSTLYEAQIEGDICLNVLRLPRNLDNQERLLHAKNFVDGINPDWISLQFVIFGYHPKGLPFGLAKKLAFISSGRKCHIMFHEIWVGFSKLCSAKHRIMGFFQQLIIHSIIKKIRPDLLTTSNFFYQAILQNSNISASVLPLFSNIPIFIKNVAFTEEIYMMIGVEKGTKKEWHIVGIFGHLRPDINLKMCIEQQLRYCRGSGLKMALVFFGRTGIHGNKEVQRLKSYYEEDIAILNLGEQTPESTSSLLQILDAGLSSTPLPYIGKSGVFAAMKLHKLNVIIPEGVKYPEYTRQIVLQKEWVLSVPADQWSVSYRTIQFLKMLETK